MRPTLFMKKPSSEELIHVAPKESYINTSHINKPRLNVIKTNYNMSQNMSTKFITPGLSSFISNIPVLKQTINNFNNLSLDENEAEINVIFL